jgi:hypothetical protein
MMGAFVKDVQNNTAMNELRLRLTYMFLFAMNIALVIRLEQAQISLSSLESNTKFRINAMLDLDPHSKVGGNTAFLALAVGIGLATWLLLWAVSWNTVVRQLLRSIAGVGSLVALPVAWLYIAHRHGVPAGLPNPPSAVLYLELAAATVCSILYLLSIWRLPVWSSIALLGVHFVLWGWLLLGGPYFWLMPVELLFPLVGFSSSLAWGIYVARS